MKHKITFSVIIALALAALIFACTTPAPVSRSGENTKVFFTAGGDGLTVASGGEIEIQSGGTLDVQGTLNNASGPVQVADALGVTNQLIYTKTTFAPTAGQTLAPTATYYSVDSTAAVSMTLGTTNVTAGQLLFLYGDDNFTVTVNDTNLLSTDGNAVTFGQYDVVGFVFNGTAWVHLYKSANQ